MTDKQRMRLRIQEVVSALMDRVMTRVLDEVPFVKESHHSEKPLYAALVPDEIFQGSHFERRFVTPFGKVWEKLAVAVAKESLGHAVTGERIEGAVKAERLTRITEVLNKLEHSSAVGKPNWDVELAYVLEGGGSDVELTVVCDVFTERSGDGKRSAFEVKAPQPNSDQTKVSKEKLLKLYAMDPIQVDEAFFALPYNPYGSKKDYDWWPPARWFNMTEDTVVLIGDEFWEKLGGKGTYQLFIESVNEIGEKYKERIYREFLGIEPPPRSIG